MPVRKAPTLISLSSFFVLIILTFVHVPLFGQSSNYRLTYCATTRYHDAVTGELGNDYGHTYIYLQGAKYSEIGHWVGLYEDSEIKGNLDKGLGVSIDLGLVNTPYIIMNDRDALLGNDFIYKTPSPSFTEKDRRFLAVESSYLFDFPRIDVSRLDKLPGKTEQEKMSYYTFGTDHHLKLARTSYCINIPMNRKTAKKMVAFINDNLEHPQGGKGAPWGGWFSMGEKQNESFQYDPMMNNCSGLLYNVLSSSGVTTPLNNSAPTVYMPWNWSLPGNTLLDIHQQLFEADFKSHFSGNFRPDPETWENVVTLNSIPWISWAFWEEISFYSPNEVFANDKIMSLITNFTTGVLATIAQKYLYLHTLFPPSEPDQITKMLQQKSYVRGEKNTKFWEKRVAMTEEMVQRAIPEIVTEISKKSFKTPAQLEEAQKALQFWVHLQDLLEQMKQQMKNQTQQLAPLDSKNPL